MFGLGIRYINSYQRRKLNRHKQGFQDPRSKMPGQIQFSRSASVNFLFLSFSLKLIIILFQTVGQFCKSFPQFQKAQSNHKTEFYFKISNLDERGSWLLIIHRSWMEATSPTATRLPTLQTLIDYNDLHYGAKRIKQQNDKVLLVHAAKEATLNEF